MRILTLLCAVLLSCSMASAQTLTVPATEFVGTTYTNATTNFTSIPNLYFPLPAGSNLSATCNIIWQGSAITTGAKYQWTGPASASGVSAGATFAISGVLAGSAAVTAFSSPMANVGTISTGSNMQDILTLNVMNGAVGGTVQLQAAANGLGTLTIQPASTCTFTPAQ